MINIKKLYFKLIVTNIVIILFLALNINIVNANDNYDIESEFDSILKKYENYDVIVENGINLNIGEKIKLEEYVDGELSNYNTVKMDKSGIISAFNTGTVFLSKNINGKVHIIEIYVSQGEDINLNKTQKVNRSYYKVFIDPGHGGSDPGASGLNKEEKQLNLEISKRIKNKLEAKGIEVKMSRESNDKYLSLQERGDLANAYGADVFVSIHQNSADSSSANGIETYYHTDKLQYLPLSNYIQRDAIKETSAYNRKVKNARFGVLRASKMPSALLECGFITNISEAKKLESIDYQEKLAKGVSNAIESYLKANIYLNGKDPVVISTGTVISESLNVRAGYGTNNDLIGKLSKGDKVEIVESKNGWHRIEYKGIYGYISGDYIKIENINKPIFKDISNHWAKDMIMKFESKGYISGYSDGTFRPNNEISRAEFIKVVNRVYNLVDKSNISFEDLKVGSWEYEEVRIGIKAGYLSTGNTKFRPNDPVTREEACKIVGMVSNRVGDGNMNFKDKNKIADYAKLYVDGLNELGIVNGYSDGTFRPQNNISRAETVKILYNSIKNI